MSDTHFRVCDFFLGDSADVLWCSTTYLEIAHAKMGSTNLTPLTPIIACVILGDSGGVQLHT